MRDEAIFLAKTGNGSEILEQQIEDVRKRSSLENPQQTYKGTSSSSSALPSRAPRRRGRS
jgi:hypothetical protein